jgi:integrase
LTREDFQLILDKATTASVAQHIRRCLTGIVAAGLEEGHLLARQDLLRGVRWHGADPGERDREPVDRAVTDAEIPTVDAVHALAHRTAERTGVWWRELQVLLVAYSGLRWGEHVALTERQVDVERRRIKVDRQSIETRSALVEGLPKGRRRRVTMFPDLTPAGVDLGQMVRRRLDEVEPGGLVFPAPQGGLQRRSNYGRYLWDRAAADIGWPKQHDGRWLWTFHSLRHVFATWALHDARIPIEDLSRLMGHSSTRVTQDIYIHVRDDMFDRFFDATAQPDRDDDATATGARYAVAQLHDPIGQTVRLQTVAGAGVDPATLGVMRPTDRVCSRMSWSVLEAHRTRSRPVSYRTAGPFVGARRHLCLQVGVTKW